MVLLIDNYDSFSYNLVQLIGKILNEQGDEEIKVIRNDDLTVKEIDDLNPRIIILSPGPGRPCDAGVCEDVVRELGEKYPILGICLGHQAICEVFGATITYAKELMHGKQSEITYVADPIFENLSPRPLIARYHSLAADEKTIPYELRVLATTTDGEIMAVRHPRWRIYGLQFHPESVLTPEGEQMMRNFLSINK